ncbi:Uncharacterized protein APZ42_031334 [Daphnia magna]|uniref:Uncharacterized protein n=1 Tax=Daphnia magna TaxID=35525 RepID=A0A164MXS2_9CRUS|nr:Uncharacterized protein APZ42_031334 [Daphnia magna]
MERLFCIAKIFLLSRAKKVSGLTLPNPPYDDFAPKPPYLSLKRILYVVGYALHKYGQEQNNCSECYSKIMTNPSHSAQYLRLIKHIDWGGLKYPSENIAARFWTLQNFYARVLPQLRNCTNIVISDLIEYIVPMLSRCSEFSCTRGVKHTEELRKLIVKDF